MEIYLEWMRDASRDASAERNDVSENAPRSELRLFIHEMITDHNSEAPNAWEAHEKRLVDTAECFGSLESRRRLAVYYEALRGTLKSLRRATVRVIVIHEDVRRA